MITKHKKGDLNGKMRGRKPECRSRTTEAAVLFMLFLPRFITNNFEMLSIDVPFYLHPDMATRVNFVVKLSVVCWMQWLVGGAVLGQNLRIAWWWTQRGKGESKFCSGAGL